jgi:hypothetical protein
VDVGSSGVKVGSAKKVEPFEVLVVEIDSLDVKVVGSGARVEASEGVAVETDASDVKVVGPGERVEVSEVFVVETDSSEDVNECWGVLDEELSETSLTAVGDVVGSAAEEDSAVNELGSGPFGLRVDTTSVAEIDLSGLVEFVKSARLTL